MEAHRDTISTGEAAELLGVSRRTISRLIARGEIPALRLTPHSLYRIRPADVLELASASGQR